MSEEKKTDTTPAPADAKAVADNEEKKEIKIDPKLEKIMDAVSDLKIGEMADLVKAMEDKFGVSAAVAVAGANGAGDGGEEEKSEYNVVLMAAGNQKIQVIKAVREITALGLKEAKDIVDSAPKEVKMGVPKVEAEELKEKLEAAGATVELK